MATSKRVQTITRTCDAELVKKGFRQVRADCVVFDFAPEFLGWIGLNIGNYGDRVNVNPFIGIHCVPMMKLVAELAGDKYQIGRLATFALHMGEICPDVDAFYVASESDSDLARESKRLADVVFEYGLPYVQRLASYAALLPLMEERAPSLGGFPQRIAATHYLMGNAELAKGYVLECQQKYKKDESPRVQDHFDRFALPFLNLLESKLNAAT